MDLEYEYSYILITQSQYDDLAAFPIVQDQFSSNTVNFDGGQYHYCLASAFDIQGYDGDDYEDLEAMILTFRHDIFTDSGRYHWQW